MKKLILILGLITAMAVSNAQNVATPNPGFDTWVTVGNYQDPTSWHTLNASTAIVGVYTCTKATGVDVHSGAAAVKLQTKSILGIKANGFISTATPITVAPYGVSGGIPYNQRPDSIVGWYKNAVVGSDTAFIEFYLKDTVSGNLIGWATCNISASHTAYTRFSIPVTYYSNGTPNLSWWNISSSARIDTYRQVNSTLWVDDINLVFNPAVLTVTPTKLTGFSATTTTPSTAKSFTLSGVYLKDSVKVQAPAEYQVSLLATTGFKSKIMLAKNGSNQLPPTTIYVRYKPTTAGVDSGYVKCTTSTATQVKVKVKGTSTVRLENQFAFDDDVLLAPNPATNEITIFNTDELRTTVTIYDLLGSKIESQVFEVGNTITFPVADLKTGVYMCRIENENGVVTKRFIKQ